jgi:hypothetical protein
MPKSIWMERTEVLLAIAANRPSTGHVEDRVSAMWLRQQGHPGNLGPYLDTEGSSSYASETWVTGNVTGLSMSVQ